MKLDEITDPDLQIKQKISQFAQTWESGIYHLHDSGQKVPREIFSMIRTVYPNSIYRGPTYRGIEFDQQEFEQFKSPNQMITSMVEYKHPSESLMFAWADDPEGVNDWLLMSGAMPDESDAGKQSEPYTVWVFIKQHTKLGISLSKLEAELVADNILVNTSRSSMVSEILAPMDPPISIEELVLVFDVLTEDGELTTTRFPFATWKELQALIRSLPNGPYPFKKLEALGKDFSDFMSY